MTESDRPEFAALLADVHGFYQQPLTQFALSVWWSACAPFPMPAVRGAMTAHATDPSRGQFCPKPADIIRALRGSSADQALAAWQRVMGQVSSVGRYGAPKLSEPERIALSAIGGWHALCNSQEDQLQHLARQFAANYAAVEAAEQRASLEAPAEIRRLAAGVINRIAHGDD